MTAGILIPAFVMSYFNMLQAGIVISLGAMCVSFTDTPGPIHHRGNGMKACIAALLVVSLIAGWAAHSPVLLGVILVICSFIFSMLQVYSARVGSVGVAALVILVLDLSQLREGWQIVENALYITAGGIWYMLFSLALYRLRPYKLAQQALGDYIQHIADYLRTRANFYEEGIDYNENYRKLMQMQVTVQNSQHLVEELLFTTRSILKESTHTGRTLVMIYLDVTDLFESVMTSYHDYNRLHEYFDDTDILKEFQQLLIELCQELEEIGLAVKSGSRSHRSAALLPHIKEERQRFSDLRKKYLKPENLDGFIGLRRILDNIQDMAERLYTLHQYTRSDHTLKRKSQQNIDIAKLVMHQEIEPKILIDNLTFRSNIFRHSLRVSISILAGYLVSLFFPLGHSYWILLTIVVILKPAYSLTKKRNAGRLIGTFFGIVAGIVILYFIKNETALLVIMIVLMAGCFSFIRKNYFVGVLLMTPYVLIFSYILYQQNFRVLLTDRMLDTLIGSVIAFITSTLLVPSWEHETIKTFMINMLKDATRYFSTIVEGYQSREVIQLNKYGVARKDALVSLANLSDAFNRMLSEPKSQQKYKEQLHQFVALNHRLVSHIATLSYYMQMHIAKYKTDHLKGVTNDSIQYLSNAINLLEGKPVQAEATPSKEALRLFNEDVNVLLAKRKSELQQGLLETDTKKELLELKSVVDQFNFIHNIAVDIQKVCAKINLH